MVKQVSDADRIINKIKILVADGNVRISEHGYDELADDDLTAREIIAGVAGALVIEEYPDYPKGRSVLFLQKDHVGRPVHAVWGIPKGHHFPAVLVTAYRPNLNQWDASFRRRMRR